MVDLTPAQAVALGLAAAQTTNQTNIRTPSATMFQSPAPAPPPPPQTPLESKISSLVSDYNKTAPVKITTTDVYTWKPVVDSTKTVLGEYKFPNSFPGDSAARIMENTWRDPSYSTNITKNAAIYDILSKANVEGLPGRSDVLGDTRPVNYSWEAPAIQSTEAKRQAEVMSIAPKGTPISAPSNTVWIPRSDLPAGGFYRTFGSEGQPLINAEGERVSYLDFGAGANRIIDTYTNKEIGKTALFTQKTTPTIALVPEGSNKAVNVSANVLANAININNEKGLPSTAPLKIGANTFRITSMTGSTDRFGEPTKEGQMPGQREAALEKADQTYLQFAAGERAADKKMADFYNSPDSAKFTQAQDRYYASAQVGDYMGAADAKKEISAILEKYGLSTANQLPDAQSIFNEAQYAGVLSSSVKAGNLMSPAPQVSLSAPAQKNKSITTGLGFDNTSGWLTSSENPLNWGQANAAGTSLIGMQTVRNLSSKDREFLSSFGLSNPSVAQVNENPELVKAVLNARLVRGESINVPPSSMELFKTGGVSTFNFVDKPKTISTDEFKVNPGTSMADAVLLTSLSAGKKGGAEINLPGASEDFTFFTPSGTTITINKNAGITNIIRPSETFGNDATVKTVSAPVPGWLKELPGSKDVKIDTSKSVYEITPARSTAMANDLKLTYMDSLSGVVANVNGARYLKVDDTIINSEPKSIIIDDKNFRDLALQNGGVAQADGSILITPMASGQIAGALYEKNQNELKQYIGTGEDGKLYMRNADGSLQTGGTTDKPVYMSFQQDKIPAALKGEKAVDEQTLAQWKLGQIQAEEADIARAKSAPVIGLGQYAGENIWGSIQNVPVYSPSIMKASNPILGMAVDAGSTAGKTIAPSLVAANKEVLSSLKTGGVVNVPTPMPGVNVAVATAPIERIISTGESTLVKGARAILPNASDQPMVTTSSGKEQPWIAHEPGSLTIGDVLTVPEKTGKAFNRQMDIANTAYLKSIEPSSPGIIKDFSLQAGGKENWLNPFRGAKFIGGVLQQPKYVGQQLFEWVPGAAVVTGAAVGERIKSNYDATGGKSILSGGAGTAFTSSYKEAFLPTLLSQGSFDTGVTLLTIGAMGLSAKAAAGATAKEAAAATAAKSATVTTQPSAVSVMNTVARSGAVNPVWAKRIDLLSKGLTGGYILSDPEHAGKSMGLQLTAPVMDYLPARYGRMAFAGSQELSAADLAKFAKENPEQFKALQQSGRLLKSEGASFNIISENGKTWQLTDSGAAIYKTDPFYTGVYSQLSNPIQPYAEIKAWQASGRIPTTDFYGRPMKPGTNPMTQLLGKNWQKIADFDPFGVKPIKAFTGGASTELGAVESYNKWIEKEGVAFGTQEVKGARSGKTVEVPTPYKISEYDASSPVFANPTGRYIAPNPEVSPSVFKQYVGAPENEAAGLAENMFGNLPYKSSGWEKAFYSTPLLSFPAGSNIIGWVGRTPSITSTEIPQKPGEAAKHISTNKPITAQIVTDEGRVTYTYKPSESTVYIKRIDANVEGQGIGTKLLKQVEKEVRLIAGDTPLTFSASAGSDSGRIFFNAKGYSNIGQQFTKVSTITPKTALSLDTSGGELVLGKVNWNKYGPEFYARTQGAPGPLGANVADVTTFGESNMVKGYLGGSDNSGLSQGSLQTRLIRETATKEQYRSPLPESKEGLIKALETYNKAYADADPAAREGLKEVMTKMKKDIDYYGMTAQTTRYTPTNPNNPFEVNYRGDMDMKLVDTVSNRLNGMTPYKFYQQIEQAAIKNKAAELVANGASQESALADATKYVSKIMRYDETSGGILFSAKGSFEQGKAFKMDVHDMGGAIGKNDAVLGTGEAQGYVGYGLKSLPTIQTSDMFFIMDPREQLVRWSSSTSIPRFMPKGSGVSMDIGGGKTAIVQSGTSTLAGDEAKRGPRFRQMVEQLGEEQGKKFTDVATRFSPDETAYAQNMLTEAKASGLTPKGLPSSTYFPQEVTFTNTIRTPPNTRSSLAQETQARIASFATNRAGRVSSAVETGSSVPKTGGVSPSFVNSFSPSVSYPSIISPVSPSASKVSPSISPASPSIYTSVSPPSISPPSLSLSLPSLSISPPSPSISPPSPSISPPSPSPGSPSPGPGLPHLPVSLNLNPTDLPLSFGFSPSGSKRGKRNVYADLLSVQYSQLKYGRATHGSAERYAEYYGREQGRIKTVEQLEDEAGRSPAPKVAPLKKGPWAKLSLKRR